jgi:type II secretory pathway predicted ATPase ExeA
MYEAFYGFNQSPFRLSVDENFCFVHRHYERAFLSLTSSLEEGRRIVLLTGLPGSGKTILCRDVISKLDPARFVTIYIMLCQLSGEELLRKIALELGLPAEQYNKKALTSSIHDYMKDLRRAGKRIIVFLDEANGLLSNEFAELKLLSSLQDLHHSVLQMVLIGSPQLREAFSKASMEYFSQGTVSTCEISSMTVDQTEEYIKHRLVSVGWNRDPVIDAPVYSIIYDVTQGIARSVNHVMSHLLLFAAFEEKHQIDIDDALTAMQMLIKDDRLTLYSEESLNSIKERYKPGIFRQQASVSQGSACVRLSAVPIFNQVDGVMIKQDPEPDDLSLKYNKVTMIDADAGQAHEDADGLFGDWDLPDTDCLDWDDHDSMPASSEVVSPSTHTSKKTHQTEHGKKQTHQGLELKPSKDEHQWRGVWWMSDNVKENARADTIVMDQLPSMKIERCPDLQGSCEKDWIDEQRKSVDVNSIKRTTIILSVVCSVALLLLLLLRFVR